MHEISKESVRVQITRHDLVSILLALDWVIEVKPCSKKWPRLRGLLRGILDEHDRKAAEKGWRD